MGKSKQVNLSTQLSHYQKSRQKLRSQLNLGIFLQKFEGLIKNQNLILKNLHLQPPPPPTDKQKKLAHQNGIGKNGYSGWGIKKSKLVKG